MTSNRSTALQLATDRCPRAIDHLEADVPYDRSVYATGIAAHAVLEGLHRAQRERGSAVLFEDAAAVAEAVVTRLVTQGRGFDGRPEAPLAPEAAAAGRDIALRWWGLPRESAAVPLDWRPEEALAMDAEGRAVPYGRDAWWRGICDLVGPVVEEAEDEYGGGVGVVVADYKSNWNAGPGWLDSIQAKGQALLALANAGRLGVLAPAFVRRAVINLRTGQTHHADLWLVDDDADRVLAGWRRDLALAMAHADARGPDGRRIAAPGAGCLGCPYVLRCEDAARAAVESPADIEPAAVATAYAAAKAIADAWAVRAKAACDRDAIPVPGGSVGYAARPEREARPELPERLAEAWYRPPDPAMWRAENGATLSLLRALDLGASAVDRVATILWPGKGPRKVDGWRDLRTALADRCLATVAKPIFGVHRDRPAVTMAEATPAPSDSPAQPDRSWSDNLSEF